MSVAATDLCRMSATELAGAIRSRQASSREVIEAHLQRIEAVNPSVNAITILLADQALEAAKAADIADGLPQAVQVIGPRYREDLCLDAAAALEDRLGIITPIDPR